MNMETVGAGSAKEEKKDEEPIAQENLEDNIENKEEAPDASVESVEEAAPPEPDLDTLKVQLEESKSSYEQSKAANDRIREQSGGEVDLGEAGKEEGVHKKAMEDLQGQITGMEGKEEVADGKNTENTAENMEGQEITPESLDAELEKMPESKQEEIKIGMKNMGFFAEKWSSEKLASLYEGASKLVKNKNGTMGRYLKSLTETFENDAMRAQKNIEEAENPESGAKTGLANVGKLAMNALKIAKFIGNPVNLLTGGSFFAKGTEAVKETRLKNEEVIGKTRVEDISAAEAEADKMYKQAQAESGEEEPSKEALEKSYQKNIPEDVLKRLDEAEPGTGSKFIQGMAKKHIEASVGRYNKIIEGIENNDKFDDKKKDFEKNRMMNKFSKRMKDWDRIVSQTGEADALAMGARWAEMGGKAAVASAVASEIWDKLPDILSAIGPAEAGAAEFPEGFSKGGSEVKEGSFDFGGKPETVETPEAVQEEVVKESAPAEPAPEKVVEETPEANQEAAPEEEVKAAEGKTETKSGSIDFGSSNVVEGASEAAVEETPDAASEAPQESPETETGEKTMSPAEKMANNAASMRHDIVNGNLSRWNEIQNVSYNEAMTGDTLEPHEKLKLFKFAQKGEKIIKPLPGMSLQEWTRQIAIKSGEKGI